jgi:hypothetical protein
MTDVENRELSLGAQDNDDHVKNITNPEANKYCPNGNPILEALDIRKWWINYHWSPETGTYADEPFRSIFDPNIIEKVPDGVKLQILPPDPSQGNAWRTSELVLTGESGEIKASYGRHLLTVRADEPASLSDLDPNAVFGFFCYQYSPAPASAGPNVHREIDLIEILRGADSQAQFTLQPYDWKPQQPSWRPFKLPPGCKVITVVNDWAVDPEGPYCAFYCFLGDYSLATLPPLISAHATWHSRREGYGQLIPSVTPTSCARFHINLWLMHGKAPSGPQSVVVTKYQYSTL